MPKLAIVIVTFNSKQDIDDCLASITGQPQGIDYEIAIVDNASRDGTAAYVLERWPGVRLFEGVGNVGFARANNLGIRETSGELVLLLNPDTIVPAGALGALAAELERRPDVAIAGPRIVDRQGRAELSFGPMLSPLAELRQKVLVTGSRRGVAPIQALVERMTNRSRCVDWVTGACLLARRADLDAVRLLDERYFMYAEDVDLCASVRARGRKVLFVAGVQIVHLRGRSAVSARSDTARAYRQSQLAFYEKHHPFWAPLLRLYLKVRGRPSDRPNNP